MLSTDHFRELEEKGYTVVKDVIPVEKCDLYKDQYREWLSQFKDGEWPVSRNSLINMYNVGHLESTWSVRLEATNVFAEIWKTDKLLTSFDAIAIGRPPEDGAEKFQDPDKHWLHVDQNASRVNLHAYQGAVYLEKQCIDDWTFEVMEGSHVYLQTFYDRHPSAADDSEIAAYYAIKKDEIHFFSNKGCEIKRVAVPKGGMAIWDSRLVHANARPIEGREHPGRWRFTVFVSMTPAIWATNDDIEMKKEAYEHALMTTHWSAQDVRAYKSLAPCEIECPKTVPDIAKSLEAKQLSGASPYDFNDGKSTGVDAKPIWETRDVNSFGRGRKVEQTTQVTKQRKWKCLIM